MLLAFDVGNTNLHLGLWDGDAWALSQRARSVPDKMADEYAVLVRNFLHSANVSMDAIDGVVIGSVVPSLTLTFVELVERYFKFSPVVVSDKTDNGVTLAIDQPQQAGADRIANAAAIACLHGGGPAFVVDFGTSTNFDVVDRHNAYCGGAICPGIGVAHDALVSRAARLHKIDLLPPPSAVGRNTIHAMQSGIFLGYLGMIEGLVTRIKAQMMQDDSVIASPDEIRVFATGGLARVFQPHTRVFDRIEPELTLDGLRVIHHLNTSA